MSVRSVFVGPLLFRRYRCLSRIPRYCILKAKFDSCLPLLNSQSVLLRSSIQNLAWNLGRRQICLLNDASQKLKGTWPLPPPVTHVAQGKVLYANASSQAGPKESRPSAALKSENIWTIPNILCFMRIGMAPLICYLILNQQHWPAIGVFAAAGISDLLDGYIARVIPGQSTVMGSFLDPMADKILVGTLFLSLTYMDLIPVALTSLIIGRDMILILSGFYIRFQSLDPPRTLSRYFDVTYPTAQLAPTWISKINTGIQLSLVGATLVSSVLPFNVDSYLEILWYITAATTVSSAVGYLFAKDTVKLLRKK